MSVLVLSSAYTDNLTAWRHLRRSAAQFGVNLEVLGVGEPHPGHAGFRKGIDFLKQRTEKYVVQTDSFDVLLSRWDESELAMLIDAAPNLVMSVEWWVWPQGPWSRAYNHLIGRYYWFAINGGQYCGRREQVIAMWEEMLARFEAGEEEAGGGSQEILHKMYLGGASFVLDLECRIFQSMYGPHAHFITPREGKAFNTITGSYPMFLHFNGGAPGIEEWAASLAP